MNGTFEQVGLLPSQFWSRIKGLCPVWERSSLQRGSCQGLFASKLIISTYHDFAGQQRAMRINESPSLHPHWYQLNHFHWERYIQQCVGPQMCQRIHPRGMLKSVNGKNRGQWVFALEPYRSTGAQTAPYLCHHRWVQHPFSH